MHTNASPTSAPRPTRRPLTVLMLAAATLGALGLLISAPATATSPPVRPMPRPTPRPAEPKPPMQARFVCEVPTDAARSVQVAFEEYYSCVQPLAAEWLGAHPQHVPQLEAQYQAWLIARGHDLRGTPEAARFVRRNPVDFNDRTIELTSAQVEELAPNLSAEPARVRGELQRIFVDRDNKRMFLTSAEEGLVALSIARRYAFEVEGSSNHTGSKDFFVIDANHAVIEDASEVGGARDLVILDISDRDDPREVRRLVGALPHVSHAPAYLHNLPATPPSFDQYRLMRQGKLQFADCGAPPTVSTHPGVACRPDGSCYVQKIKQTPDTGICERQVGGPVLRPMPRQAFGENVDELADSGPMTGRGGIGRVAPQRRSRADFEAPMAAAEMDAPAPTDRAAPRQEMDTRANTPMPQGGTGGAGSLSQMMLYGNTLYVLSAAGNIPKGWLSSFDVSNPRQPRLRHIIGLDNGPEALQRHDNLLLIAGRDAVMTASLGTAHAPRLLGEFRQFCPVNYDPVVVQGTVAYRTIIVDQPRSRCTSRLEVIDLSQPHSPTLRTTLPISRPRGLAVLGERLFVADEHHGVQIFDLSDPVAPSYAATWQIYGVKDLVVSDFDLFALSPNEVQTFDLAPLYERDVDLQKVASETRGHLTVVRASNHRVER
ncbi:hypothetical protein FRC96_00090 [Lujinxingia vulgaris]|uniref:Uncharacterized protein n=1 Tax=Lujinxingia vulgaris TaxID=2600176 RepID=A0A5C6XJX9_9DELT|nr:hypothetical protein [Lujinxingia vulgaris]TXD44759.1 hypothetical protein FRC96_00090 [Lujinxingia vulgaris]